MNILIAMDSSPTAQAALAATLARDWPEASFIRVLTVIPERGHCKEISKLDLLDAYRRLDQWTEKIESKNPDSIVVGQIHRGELSISVLKVAHAWPADLVVVAADEKAGLIQIFKQSIAETILAKAACSVLIARDVQPTKPANRALIALDGESINSKSVVDMVLAASCPENTTFHIVTIVKPNYKVGSFEPNAFAVVKSLEKHGLYISSLQKASDELKRKLENRFACFNFESSVVEGEPEDTILKIAKIAETDLILVGSTGKSELKHRILGSVSQTVALQGHCSVQVVRSSVTPLFNRVSEPAPARRLHRAVGF